MSVHHTHSLGGAAARRPHRRRLRSILGPGLALAVGCLLTLQLPAAAQQELHAEDSLKAAFLVNFARFVEWPAEAFDDAESPLVIGVLGDRAFVHRLRKSAVGRRLRGRSLEVRTVRDAATAEGSHILFVRSAEEKRYLELRSRVAELPVLTVGESPSFAREGGTVTFVVEGDHLRFVINMAGPDRTGLRISAQLQKLASLVVRGE